MVDEIFKTNEKEIMEYYNIRGIFATFRIRWKFFCSWVLHGLAYSNPLSSWTIRLQKSRGVIIGKNCHISPYVLLDLVYPNQITIDDNVTIGSHVMIFAHSNPTANLFLKNHKYPRVVKPVHIKSGAVIAPGSIITVGVTIGKNSMISAGSVVSHDVEDFSVVAGNPARMIKKIE